MSDTSLVARDPVARTLSWVASRGVEVRPWPPAAPDDPGALLQEPPVRPDGTAPLHPVLYLVEPGSEPPFCHDLEDWVRLPLDPAELTARADRLVAWSRGLGAEYTRVDENDILRVGDQLAVLSPLEARLVRTLVDSLGMLVTRDELMAAVWPDGPPSDPRALDNRVKAVRARLRDLPLQVHTVHGRGLILERQPD